MVAYSVDIDIAPTPVDLEEIFWEKYGRADGLGWSPRLRRQFEYFTPDEWYEAVVNKLLNQEACWLDVGCGRALFPDNPFLAKRLARTCKLLVGLDPDDTLLLNPYVHEKIRTRLDEYDGGHQFDLVTMRMVAEHVVNPLAVMKGLLRVTRPGSLVVVYTIYQWSPIPVLTRLIPFRLHHPIKRFLWRTEAKDTFPVAYKMNTRANLRQLFAEHGFAEYLFAYLDDCRTFSRFRASHYVELVLWRWFHARGLHYPEVCLLGVYRRGSEGGKYVGAYAGHTTSI